MIDWNELDNKLRKKIDREFVSCKEDYELNYIKEIILEEYSFLDDELVNEALKYCCEKVKAPRPRDKFIKCLIKYFIKYFKAKY